MSGSGREFLPDGREKSGCPPECPGVVGKPSRMSRSGREAHPNVREWSEDPPDVREWSGCSRGFAGEVERPSRMSRSSRKALPDVWDW